MTDNNHPMLPTQEQLTEWDSERFDEGENFDVMMIKAFQAGADQELDACCEWFRSRGYHPEVYRDLRAARRKPPSLKEQALQALDQADKGLSESEWQQRSNTIRRALESLPS